MNFRLPKTERLHSQKSIKELFNESSSFFLYPFKVLYLEKDTIAQNPAAQVLFSVSKRKVKNAVQRNLIKRRMREAYRINKHLLPKSTRQLYLGLIYVSSDMIEFHTLERKIKQILLQISQEINQTPK